jgi:hypothetical protein
MTTGRLFDKRDEIIRAMAKLVLLMAQAMLMGGLKPGTMAETDIAESRLRLQELIDNFDPEDARWGGQ